MKKRLLELLACPSCNGNFSLKIEKEEKNEIKEGSLICSCGNTYPVIRFIPRMITGTLSNLQNKTHESFGFEWNVFHKMFNVYRQNFLNYISPIHQGFFGGKVVLDAGCGVGRHSYWAAQFGAKDVISIDLSLAVEASYKNTGEFDNLHILQADIYNLPFKKEIFDYVMCIGVLHHLPDPEGGFCSLVPFVKKRGTLSIWVYGKKHNVSNVYIYESIRKFTRHIPHRILYYLCYIPALGVEFMNRLYTLFNRFTLTKPLTRLIPFKYYSLFPFDVKLNDAFDVFATPKSTYWLKSQIVDWYKKAGFTKFEVSYLRKKSLKAYGIKS